MRLMDDIHLDNSLSEVSLSSDLEGADLTTRGKRQADENKKDDSNEQSLFDFTKSL